LENNHFKTAVETRQMTQFPASARTARRRIRTASNLRNYAAAKNPFLTQANKDKRVGVCITTLYAGCKFLGKCGIYR
jgi:hypothetical protein